MRFESWLTKTTVTHSEYAILIAFRWQQWLRERATVLRYAYTLCLVSHTWRWADFMYFIDWKNINSIQNQTTRQHETCRKNVYNNKHVKFYNAYVEIKCQLDATEVLLQILLLAQHVSGTTMPIIRSSRVLYSGCCLWYFVLWFSSCWSDVELRVMCPVCRMLQLHLQ